MATAKLFGKFVEHLAKKRMDLTADSLKVMLCSSAYVPDQDAHDFKDDVTNELALAGYTAGGVALGSITFTYDSATNTWVLDAADASWTSNITTARIAVLYDSTPATDATRPLIGYVDFGTDQSHVGGVFTIPWPSTGILRIGVQ